MVARAQDRPTYLARMPPSLSVIVGLSPTGDSPIYTVNIKS